MMKRVTRVSFTFLSLIAFSLTVTAQITIPKKSGSGITFIAADSSFSVKLNSRIQNLYVGEKDLNTNRYEDRVLVRRARLKLEGFAFNPNLEYKLQLGLSNDDVAGATSANSNTANIVMDALVKWNFAPGYSLQFGQAKLPGNREMIISSQKLQFVDRSLLNARYSVDRDMGIQLHHESAIGKAVFRQQVAVSMGEGENITQDNEGGYSYTGRLEFLPLGEFEKDGDLFGADLKREPSPKLSVGLGYDFNDDASRERGHTGGFLGQTRDIKTIFADLMFKFRGFSAMAEYADRKTDGSPVVTAAADGSIEDAFFTGTGFNIQAGYVFKNNFEVAGRYTTINPHTMIQQPENNQFTLGLSKYLMEHTVKIQSDVSLLEEQNDFNELMYRFQIEIGF